MAAYPMPFRPASYPELRHPQGLLDDLKARGYRVIGPMIRDRPVPAGLDQDPEGWFSDVPE